MTILKVKFTRLEIAIIIAIIIFCCSCSGKLIPGNTASHHYFSKQQVALRAYNDSLKTARK